MSDAFKLYCHSFPSISSSTHKLQQRQGLYHERSVSGDTSGSLQKVRMLLLCGILCPWSACASLLMAESQTGGLFSWLLQCCQKYISSSTEISMSMWPVLPSKFYFSPLSKYVRFKVTFLFYKALKDVLWYASGLRQQLSTQVQRMWLSQQKSQGMRQQFPGDWSRITSDLITLWARQMRNLRLAFVYKSSWTWWWMNTYATFIVKNRMDSVHDRCCGLWLCFFFLAVLWFESMAKKWHKNLNGAA